MNKIVFSAIRIQCTQELSTLIEELKILQFYPGIRLIRPSNFHVTLRYYGPTDEEKIRLISAGLNRISQNTTAFNINLKGCGTFGKPPGVIWCGVSENTLLLSLAKQIENMSLKFGYPKQPHPFCPHISLVRLKNRTISKTLNTIIRKYEDVEFGNSRASYIELIESIRSEKEVIYNTITQCKTIT